jgi:type I restriction-modification system DNA methylase subunit
VDYGFKLADIPKFYIEAKSFREDLNNLEFINQAINYAWLKSVTWAVLTNFEGLKVFNAEWESRNPRDKIYIDLKWDEFIEKFDRIWLLSKDSFLNNELNKEAEEYGKKIRKTPVTPVMKQIFNDLMTWRENLTKNIMGYDSNRKIVKTEEELDEAVQRIIDRLIFIRVCEDRGIEKIILQSKLREWIDSHGKHLIDILNGVFREFDKGYNSKLFAPHPSEDLKIDDGILAGIINNLYESSDKVFKYDFSVIDADVLGNIYEEYLGYVLRKSEKRTKIKENHAYRKGMGIYYTPTFVVDYIVKNTIGKLLERLNPKEIENIKILDLTCGSGSFLLKAFDLLNNYHKSKNELDFLRKIKILTTNIYGVDLDPKAIEIAQLNLLLKTLERRRLLPKLQENLKIGNSFIDDPKLSNKYFKWEEKFKDGFNVIIGNPPYVHQKGKKGEPKISFEEREYYRKHYTTIYSKDVKTRGGIKINVFVPYVERSLSILKNNGLMGFIVHKNILKVESYKILRKFILDNCCIIKIVDFGSQAFEEITGETVIIILQKEKDAKKRNENTIEVVSDFKTKDDFLFGKYNVNKIKQKLFYDIPDNIFAIYINENLTRLHNKTKQNSEKLGTITKIISFGLDTINNKQYVSANRLDEKYKPCLMGRNIGRYAIKDSKFVLYDKKVLSRIGDENAFNSDEKLVMQRIGSGLITAYDNKKHYCFNSTNMILKKDKNYNLKYILALLNSKLINFYYRATFTSFANVTVNATQGYLSEIPIKIPSPKQQKEIIELVDRILDLNQQLQKINPKSDRGIKLQEEINRIDKQIDQKVYDIYGLTEKEIKIVESS